MLETDEVDDDYFTPQSSTTLANIFESSSRQEGVVNETLKYTPPKAQTLPKPKVTECVFACSLFAYKWSENNYEPMGKIGFALIKNIINNNHNVVLYDSNKTTLSSTTVTPEFKIIVKGNLYISYYDSLHRYWSIYANEEEINKIIDLLKNLNAVVVHSLHSESGPPEPHKIERDNHSTIQSEKKEKESDTDSTLNRRTKDSILSRMANMGQSVLPRHLTTADKTSDSSDTNDNNDYPKSIRHKPIKNTMKRIISDNPSEIHHPTSSHRQIVPTPRSSVNTLPIYTNVDGQLVPMENTNTVSSKNDANFNLFMTEQRISNSELRINIGRINDKMDKMLDNIKESKDTDKSKVTSNFQIEILQKLLVEYENKIKAYEQIIKMNNIETNIIQQINIAKDPKDDINKIELYENNISKLEQVIFEKNKEITNLNEEIKLIKQKHIETLADQTKREAKLHEQNKDLKQSLLFKQEELEDTSMRLKENLQAANSDKYYNTAMKLKDVMNDTFHAISVNFENDKYYSGETIKSTVAAVIKKVTMESLGE